MPKRTASAPSPVKSGMVHGALSLMTFAAIGALAVTSLQVRGNAQSSAPVIRLALFDVPTQNSPVLKSRMPDLRPGSSVAAPIEMAYPEPPMKRLLEPADAQPDADLGVEYGKATPVASEPDIPENAIRINGRIVKTGQSLSQVADTLALARAPVADVTEQNGVRMLPKIGENGRTPAGVYARPFANSEKRPTVSVVVGGLGINWRNTQSAIDELPAEITLSFAPTADDLQTWITKARSAGHEVLIELPMEPYDFGREPPHPQTLYELSQASINVQRLENLLSQATGYYGVTNYQGGKLATNPAAIAPILSVLKDRGVAFVEDGSLARSVLEDVANRQGLRYARADRLIDSKQAAEDINKQLLALETSALNDGASLGSAFAYPVTIDVLKEWTTTLEGKGIMLAPTSSVTRAVTRKPHDGEQTPAISVGSVQSSEDVLNNAG